MTTLLNNTSLIRQLIYALENCLAAGLSVQTALVFWPIGNYSTLVYLLFYFPILTIVFLNKNKIIFFLLKADRVLVAAICVLLAWVVLSSYWSTNTDAFLENLKQSLLISLYILGVGYLAFFREKLLHISLISLFTLSSLIIVVSLLESSTVIFSGSPKYRLSHIGYLDWKEFHNPVVLGIYFGGIFSASIAHFLSSLKSHKNALIPSFILITAILILCFTYLTKTRTALAGITFAIIFVFAQNQRYKLVYLVCFGLFSIAALGFYFDIVPIKNLVMRGGLGSWRPQIWLESLNQAVNNYFWFGAGMGSDTIFHVTRGEVTTQQNHSHNFYLQILTWCGLVGLSLYLLILLRTLQIGTKFSTSVTQQLALSCLAYFLCVQFFDVHNIFSGPSYYWPFIWLPIGIILGLSIKQK